MITIYTDGSAHPNPGPGGWGAIVFEDNELIEVKQFLTDGPVTNNRMEMEAIYWAFKKYGIDKEKCFTEDVPILYSDSSYALDTFRDWMFKWERNGWKKSDNTTPKNLDIVQFFYMHNQDHIIFLHKVKGHSNNICNNIADQLATGKITEKEVWERYG